MRKSVCLPVFCDCVDLSAENLHYNATSAHVPQAVGFKWISKKHNRNSYLAIRSWVDTQKTQLFCDFTWGPYYYKPDCSSLPFLPAEDQALAAGLGLTYS